MMGDFIGVEDRLRNALQAGQLSGEREARGEALLSRLISPVRVAVLGLRRSGKTSVFNVLAGAPVLPLDRRLPTAQLVWGEAPETVLTYPDRSSFTFDVPTAEEWNNGTPIFVAMQRDLPSLDQVALLEVVMDGDLDKQSRALSWAAARCDLIVWCTRAMDEMELHLLSMLPATLRKHAVIALTHIDRLRGTDAVEAQLEEVRTLVGEDTQMVCPVDARAAATGLETGGAAASGMVMASGGKALEEAVLAKVEAGYARVREAAEKVLEDAALDAARAAVLDAVSAGAPAPAAKAVEASVPADAPPPQTKAETDHHYRHKPVSDAPSHSLKSPSKEGANFFKLEVPAPKHQPAFAAEGLTRSQSASSQDPEPQLAEPAPETYAAPETRVSAHADPAAPLASAAPIPDAEAPAAASAEETLPRLSVEGQDTVAGAIRYLAERGSRWAKTARSNPEAASTEIMTDILGDAEWLASYLGEPFGNDEPLLAPAREMAEDILDLVQLMEVEHTDSATSDAVCLMLQAQRRLQWIAAAA